MDRSIQAAFSWKAARSVARSSVTGSPCSPAVTGFYPFGRDGLGEQRAVHDRLASGGDRGSWVTNAVPVGVRSVAVMVPPCRATIAAQMARPRPVPGRLSRASLVYEVNGERKTVDSTGNCEDALERASKLREEADCARVRLSGPVIEEVSGAWLVLEDETGTRALPVSVTDTN